MLPKGVQIVPYYDRSWLIDRTLRTVFTNLLEGAALVCAVLILFLSNLRAALIVAAVIPLSLLGTFLGLTFVGHPGEPAVAGRDGLRHHRRRRGDRGREHLPAARPRTTNQRSGVRRRRRCSRPPSRSAGRRFFSMLIIIVAHVPIFTLQRHEGRIFAPMAWTVTSALVTSLILSLTVVPLACSWFLRRVSPTRTTRSCACCKARYAVVLDRTLARRGLIIGVALVALVRYRCHRHRGSGPNSCRSSTRARPGSTWRWRRACRRGSAESHAEVREACCPSPRSPR